jgi:hypothetical protein
MKRARQRLAVLESKLKARRKRAKAKASPLLRA